MQYFFLYAIAVYGLMMLVPFFIIFQRLSGLLFQHPSYQVKPSEEVPDYIQQVFQHAMAELEAIGFWRCLFYESEDVVGVKRWGALMQHSANNSFATLGVNALPDPANPVTINFYTFFREGNEDWVLTTMNGLAHGIIGRIPNAIVQDEYVTETQAQWQVHIARFTTLNTSPIPLSPQSFIEKLQSHESYYIDSLIATKMLTRVKGTASYQLRIVPALKVAIQIGRGNNKRMAMMRKRSAQAKAVPETKINLPVEAEVDAYYYQQHFEQVRPRKGIKSIVLVVSLIISALSFTHLFIGQSLLILIGVLFLHELGHFFTMKYFGYTNTSIFFLPFFGAAASGHKEKATLSEKVFVLLAGPMPGLILGCAIALLTPSELQQTNWLSTSISFLIILNLLNLLPIFPLDGGRVVNLLLFARYPWADVVFKGVTLAIVLALVIASSDLALLFLVVIIGTSLSSSIRSAKILGQFDRKSIQFDQPFEQKALVTAIFNAIQKAGYSAMPYIQKYNLAKSLVQLLQEPQASLKTRVGLTALYLFCLVGSVVLGAFSMTNVW